MYDIVTIGTGTRDVFLRSPLFKPVHDPGHLARLGFTNGNAQCFPSGAKIEVARPVMTVGGGAANAAVTFARQGFNTAALIKIGRDPNGQAIITDLHHENIKPFTLFDKQKGTAYSVVLLSGSGERTILNYRGASEDIRKKDLALQGLRARWAYIVPGHIPFPVISAAVKKLAADKTKIAMNPSAYYVKMKMKKLKPLLKHVEILTLNREEAAAITGVSYQKEEKIFKALEQAGCGVVVMTDGSRGVLVWDGAKIYQAGVYKEKELVDRTGAGDAFGSGFVASLMRGDPIEKAIKFASANATSVVEHIGAQEGILSKKNFERQKRWAQFKIKVRN